MGWLQAILVAMIPLEKVVTYVYILSHSVQRQSLDRMGIYGRCLALEKLPVVTAEKGGRLLKYRTGCYFHRTKPDVSWIYLNLDSMRESLKRITARRESIGVHVRGKTYTHLMSLCTSEHDNVPNIIPFLTGTLQPRGKQTDKRRTTYLNSPVM